MEKKFLENLIKLRRVPGGLLFYGKEGSGKTHTAFEFARGVLCLKGEAWGCNECPSCKHVNEIKDKFFKGETEELKVYEEKDGKKQFVYLMGEHPDFIVVVPHGNYIKIDQIRKVKEFAYIRPALSRRKVILIDDAHTMTNQSANALLKVLEEPPADTSFILTTSRRSAILPTILSRTFQVEFKGFTKEEVMKLANVDEEIAELSGGSLKKALLLKEKRGLIDKAKKFIENEPYEVYKIATEFENWEAEEKRLFLDLLEAFLMRKPSEETALVLDKIRLMKEGIPRGINGTLWLIEISANLSENRVNKG